MNRAEGQITKYVEMPASILKNEKTVRWKFTEINTLGRLLLIQFNHRIIIEFQQHISIDNFKLKKRFQPFLRVRNYNHPSEVQRSVKK